MIRLRRTVGALAALLGLTGGAVAQAAPLVHAHPESVGFSSAHLHRLDQTMQTLVDQGQIAGAVTLLSRHGQIAALRSFGKLSLESGEPMPADAIFRIRSETKPVTGVAMMILYDQGLWKLDDPITKFVPEFAGLRIASGVDAEGQPILTPVTRPPTMRELMTHTAGFAYGIADDPGSQADQAYFRAGVLQSASPAGPAAARSRTAPLRPAGHPVALQHRGRHQGYIVEKLSGQPLPVFMEERIFQPLGMKDTAFWARPEKQPRLAAVYDADPATGKLVPVVEGAWRDVTRPPAAPSGGGGLLSTAADFARFAQMILNGGDLDGKRILEPETVALMRQNHLPRQFSSDDQRHRQCADSPGSTLPLRHRHGLRPRRGGGHRSLGLGRAGRSRHDQLGRQRRHLVLDRSGQ
ncbi:serine hydrolase [Caulobacter sp. B11]|nr:serine hydrolase [Caulobacter sp. B11]